MIPHDVWLEVLVFTAFAVGLVVMVWRAWHERQAAERQAKAMEELAEIGRGVKSLAHDLHHYFAAIEEEVVHFPDDVDAELRASKERIELAAKNASSLMQTIRGDNAPAPREAPAEGVVRLAMMLVAGTAVPVDLEVSGSFGFFGTDTDALRAVQNVLVNAVRESVRHPAGRVRIDIGEERLIIANAIDPTDAARLDESIYDSGVSHRGGNGLGLATARDCAGKVGWRLGHVVEGDEVQFLFEYAEVRDVG